MRIEIALCIAALTGSAAQAGTVEQAFIFADPQMQVKDGAIRGCGYRLKGMPNDIATAKSVVLLDASFNLFSGAVGLLKGGATQVTLNNGVAGTPVNRPIESFWIMAQGERPTPPPKTEVTEAETKGYLLYVVPMDATLPLFAAVREQTPLMIGMRIKGEGIDHIYAGTVQVSDKDQAQVSECMGELIKQMDRDLEAEKPARR